MLQHPLPEAPGLMIAKHDCDLPGTGMSGEQSLHCCQSNAGAALLRLDEELCHREVDWLRCDGVSVDEGKASKFGSTADQVGPPLLAGLPVPIQVWVLLANIAKLAQLTQVVRELSLDDGLVRERRRMNCAAAQSHLA